jgi:nitrogen fixation-related uncharacterized protein
MITKIAVALIVLFVIIGFFWWLMKKDFGDGG